MSSLSLDPTPAGRPPADTIAALGIAYAAAHAGYHGAAPDTPCGSVPDPSRQAETGHAAALRGLQARLAHLDRSGLTRAERFDVALLSWYLSTGIGLADAGLGDVLVADAGLPTDLLGVLLPTVTGDPPVPPGKLMAYLAALRRRWAAAWHSGQTAPASCLRRLSAILETIAHAPVFDTPALGAELAALRRLLHQALSRRARDDDHAGLCHLPDGAASYQTLIAHHTGTTITPTEAHRRLMPLIDALTEQIADLGHALVDRGDPAGIRAELTARYGQLPDGTDLAAALRAALDRTAAMAPGLADGYRLPALPVRNAPWLELAPQAGPVVYQPASPGRPAVLYLTTPPGRRLAADQLLDAAIGAGPIGHHLHATAATMLSSGWRTLLPTPAAATAGWGGYCRTLATRPDAPCTHRERLGILLAALTRTVAAAVDTGIHHAGWTAPQALTFAAAHLDHDTAHDLLAAAIWQPGRAVADVLPADALTTLAAHTALELGAAFRPADFHHTILAAGPTPPGLLPRVVADWMRTTGHP